MNGKKTPLSSLLYFLPLVYAIGLLIAGVWLGRHPVVSPVMQEQLRLLATRDALTAWVFTRHRGASKRELDQLMAIAQQHPDDWRLALASTTESLDGAWWTNSPPVPHGVALEQRRLQRFTTLMERFPDRPEIPATALRLACQARIHHRGEWARIAAHGRKVDPDNAFFDQMYAWFLRQQGREAEAWAVLIAGAHKNRWNDYSMAEMDAVIALQERLGTSHSFVTAATSFAVLLPHFIVLREQAREAVDRANRLETSGRRAEANRLLLAQARLGALMAAQTNTSIGVFVGEAVAKIVQGGASDPAAQAWIVARLSELKQPADSLRNSRVSEEIEQVYRRANSTLGMYRRSVFWLGFSLLALLSLLIFLLGGRLQKLEVFAVVALIAFAFSLSTAGMFRASALGTALGRVEPIRNGIFSSQSSSSNSSSSLLERVQEWLSHLGVDFYPRSLRAPLVGVWGLALGAACGYGLWRAARSGVSAVAETRRVLLWMFCIGCTVYYLNLWNYAHINHEVNQTLRVFLKSEPQYFWRKAGIQPPPVPPSP